MMNLPQISTLQKEGPFMASKWAKQIALLDPSELQELFNFLGSFFLYPIGSTYAREDIEIIKTDFIKKYSAIIEKLKDNGTVSREDLKDLSISLMTLSTDSLYLIEVQDKYMVKPKRPMVMIKPHFFDYSDQFRSNVLGEKSLFWGLEFSFPKIYQDPITKQIENTADRFENTNLFTMIRKWLRDHSRITTFIVDGKKIHVPYRIGKKCISWMEKYHALRERNIFVGNHD